VTWHLQDWKSMTLDEKKAGTSPSILPFPSSAPGRSTHALSIVTSDALDIVHVERSS
jgi:hypothetical protein